MYRTIQLILGAKIFSDTARGLSLNALFHPASAFLD
jgi:hypothetical protein